eukprot:GHVT01071353.1.p1 GENE.GHVT01071353.1~~GHVT01071353.1.p1  ORF type:complete len:382 (-),score=11.84 GHVT01071353.1:295-1440(-)
MASSSKEESDIICVLDLIKRTGVAWLTTHAIRHETRHFHSHTSSRNVMTRDTFCDLRWCIFVETVIGSRKDVELQANPSATLTHIFWSPNCGMTGYLSVECTASIISPSPLYEKYFTSSKSGLDRSTYRLFQFDANRIESNVVPKYIGLESWRPFTLNRRECEATINVPHTMWEVEVPPPECGLVPASPDSAQFSSLPKKESPSPEGLLPPPGDSPLSPAQVWSIACHHATRRTNSTAMLVTTRLERNALGCRLVSSSVFDYEAETKKLTFYFPTSPRSRKCSEFAADPTCSLCWSFPPSQGPDPSQNGFVVFHCDVSYLETYAEVERVWHPAWAPFYPGGAKSTDLRVYKLDPTSCELYDQTYKRGGYYTETIFPPYLTR